jgi:hypothetical protein
MPGWTTSRMTMIALMAAVLFSGAGCSTMREDPTDAFAPRPENATSTSYRMVRLDEGRHGNTWDRASLLAKIARYRKQYQSVKDRSDFGKDYVAEHSHNTYQVRVKSFLDSDLDAAEQYLQSLPDDFRFMPADPDDGKRDIGDIDWTDDARALRVVDFYAQQYTDDWSPYAFGINLIPTARDGYGKLSLNVHGESLAFRRAVRKRIWTFSSGYFWVYTRLLVSQEGKDRVPMLVVIADPNDRSVMNGTYLIMPRSLPAAVRTAADGTITTTPAPSTTPASDPWDLLTTERLDEATIIAEELKRGLAPEKIVTTLKKRRGSDQSEDVLFQLIALCQQDANRFAQRIAAMRQNMRQK